MHFSLFKLTLILSVTIFFFFFVGFPHKSLPPKAIILINFSCCLFKNFFFLIFCFTFAFHCVYNPDKCQYLTFLGVSWFLYILFTYLLSFALCHIFFFFQYYTAITAFRFLSPLPLIKRRFVCFVLFTYLHICLFALVTLALFFISSFVSLFNHAVSLIFSFFVSVVLSSVACVLGH